MLRSGSPPVPRPRVRRHRPHPIARVGSVLMATSDIKEWISLLNLQEYLVSLSHGTLNHDVIVPPNHQCIALKLPWPRVVSYCHRCANKMSLRDYLQPVLQSQGIVSLDDCKRIDEIVLASTSPTPPLTSRLSSLSIGGLVSMLIPIPMNIALPE